jgi:hypothetical protein
MAFECEGSVFLKWAHGFDEKISLLNVIKYNFEQILINRDFLLQTFCIGVRLTLRPFDCKAYIPTMIRILLFCELGTMWKTKVVSACFEPLGEGYVIPHSG